MTDFYFKTVLKLASNLAKKQADVTYEVMFPTSIFIMLV